MKNSRKFPSAERSSVLNFSSHPTSFEISSCYILPVKFGFLKSLLLWIWHFPHSTFHCILPLQRAEFQLPVYTDHKFIEGWNFEKSTFRWGQNACFQFLSNKWLFHFKRDIYWISFWFLNSRWFERIGFFSIRRNERKQKKFVHKRGNPRQLYFYIFL